MFYAYLLPRFIAAILQDRPNHLSSSLVRRQQGRTDPASSRVTPKAA